MATVVLGERPTAAPRWRRFRASTAVERLGRGARESFETTGRAGRFMIRAVPEGSTWRPMVTTQARRLGVDSVPIGLFIAVFTGIVLALLASYSFTGAVPLYSSARWCRRR